MKVGTATGISTRKANTGQGTIQGILMVTSTMRIQEWRRKAITAVINTALNHHKASREIMVRALAGTREAATVAAATTRAAIPVVTARDL